MKYRAPFNVLGDLYGSTVNRPHPHRGVDYPVAKGSKIRAVATGTIVDVTWNDALGNVVVLLDQAGIYWGFCHLDATAKGIRAGKRVFRGALLGTVGQTGTAATGPHLHLTASQTAHGYMVGLTLDPLKVMKGIK